MWCGLALALAVIALLSPGGTAYAAPHATVVLPCERCHTLDDQSNEPLTTYLSSAAPNFSIMLGITGGNVPAVLGCYLCHTESDRKSTSAPPKNVMKDVSGDFGSQTSMHAVGRKISDGTDTENEVQSNWTGNALAGASPANVPDELQCVWCHNVTGGAYPDHYPGLQAADPANPNMLYNVTAAADKNNLCFGRCHVGTSFANGGSTVTVPAMGHVGWAKFSDNGTPADKADDTMVTGRNSAIKTADCALCHNTHSSNKPDMIRDGLSEGGTAIDEDNCTAVCHNTPTQWATKGHGQFGTFANTSCGPCHSTAVSHRTTGNAKRFGFPEDATPSSIGYDGATDGLDNDFDGGADAADPGNNEAAWVQPRESMCRGCHQTFKEHGGDVYKDASTGGTSGYASCLDCHDPHGAGVAAANLMMVRGAIGATAGGATQEATAYTGAADFYNAGGTGVCDNANCHGATFTAILANPASSAFTVHSAAGVTTGTNCVLCHRHDSTSGGFAANCNDCHNYPPATGAHVKHRALGYNCWDCHFGNNHNPTMIAATPATFDSLYSRNQIELGFNPAGFNSDANNGTLAAPVATKAFGGVAVRVNTTCTGLACHNPDNAVTGKVLAADATNNIPVWGNIYDACTDCHARSDSGDPPNKSHFKHDSKYQCGTCHADVNVGPTGPGRATHAKGVLVAGAVSFGGTIGADTIPAGTSTVPISGIPVATYAAGVCSNTYCHGNFTGGTTTNLPNWSAKTGGACGNCHGATAAAPPQGNAHPQHTGNDQSVVAERQYSYPCNYCHVGTTSNGTTITGAALHVNGYSNFAFDATVPMLVGAVYGGDTTVGNNATDPADICSTAFCHGAGATFPATMVGTDTTPEWNVATTANCGTCHLDTTATWNGTGSNKHQAHVGTVGNAYNMGCDICHYSVTTDGATIAATGSANHVNFQANVVFSATDVRLNTTLAPVSSYGGTTVVGSGYGTCDNTYCHSPGTDLVPPFQQPPNSALMAWDNFSTSCSNCHSGPTGGGPGYADGTMIDGTAKANKHPIHRNIYASASNCNTCHGWLDTAFATYHANGDYDPTAGTNNALDDFNFTRGAVAGGVNGTCDTVVCHGGNPVAWAEDMAAVPWSANNNHFTCDVCHGEVLGNPTNTDVNDFSIDITAAGAVMSKVSASEYAAVGHGDTAPRNISKACNACHDSTVTHETGAANLSGASPLSANPFRLRDQDVPTPNLQFSCSYNNASCHVAGTVGPQTGKTLGSIVTHSNEAMAPDTTRTWPAWNPRCTECHDPHGDGTNLSMVQREIYDKGSTVQSLNSGSEHWGVPALPNDNNAVAFTDALTGILVGSYAEPTPNFSGVCQECHERSTATGGVAAFHDGPVGGTEVTGSHPTPPPSDCSSCHTHDKAFKAQGCFSCHGNTVTRAYWPDGAAYPDIAGAHLNHVNTVGMWIYGENGNVAGAGLLGLTANGSSDTKQKAVCAWCHPNPGLARAGKAGETNHDDNGVQSSPADVLGDGVVAAQPQLYYNGTLAPLPRGSVTDTDATFTAGTHSCSNVNCHNQIATPTGANNWNVPPVWTTTGCGTIQCHSTPAASGAHATHVDAAGKSYPCAQCHVNPASLQHGNGQVNLDWTAGLESDGDGFYDHDASGTSTPALDNNFTPEYGGAVPQFRCWNIYCHGDFTGGLAANQPRWGTVADGDCGTCHNATSVTLTNGSHPTHFDPSFGPNLGASCGTCHTGSAQTVATHVDGTKSFETRKMAVANPAATNLAGTEVCNACHGNSSGTRPAWIATVKTAWPTPTGGDYTTGVTCESCHGQYDVANSSADNTGVAALSVMGNGSTYGSAVTGHTRPGGQYPVSNNNPAAKACVTCHAFGAPHTWGVDTPGYPGLRIVGSLNTVNLGAATQVEEVCNACHQVVGTANGDQVSSHGNMNPSFTTSNNHDPFAQDFVYRCDACHDVHGLTLNAGGAPNVFMVKRQVEVQNYSTPGAGVSPGTTIDVQFTSKTGLNSFDDGSGTGVCTTCHNNANRPGFGSNMTNYGGQHSGLAGYSNNEQGSDCSGCHAHTWDTLTLSQDGFMPQLCNACHTYPGLLPVVGTHMLSAVHDIHAGAPGLAGPVNYNFPCKTCHFNFDHNQTGLEVGQVWSGPAANVNIQFDPARNGGTPTYGGLPAFGISAPGVGGTGTCAGLYCHGDAAPFPTGPTGTANSMAGSDTTPQWNVVATGDCGTCHLDTTATWNGTGSNWHGTHVGTTGGYNQGCDICHYTVSPDGATVPAASMPLHVNGSANVAFSTTDKRLNTTLPPVSTYGGDAVVGSGYGTCGNTFCHSKANDLVPPFQQPPNSATMTWDSVSSSCSDCHDSAAGGGPGYANGTLIDGTAKANRHQQHRSIRAAAAVPCSACHGWYTTSFTTYHVNGSYDPTGGGNNTLDDFTFTRGAVAGGVNGTCSVTVCHGGNTVDWGENMTAVPWNANSNHFTCDICHGEVGGAPTNADVNDFAIDITAAGAVMSKVGAAEYATYGHGASAGALFPRNITKACNACHDSTVNHEINAANLSGPTSPNPFRLSATGSTCSTAAGCHTAGLLGPATTKDISLFVTHSDDKMLNPGLYTAKRTWPGWNPRCTECHDPHGDGINLSMIQRELYDKGSTVLGVDTTNEDWGVPRTNNDNNALVFTDNATGQNAAGSSYADTSADFSSVCQECHEAANHVSYQDGATGTGAGGTADSIGHPASPLDCSGCHKHDTAFKPSGCNGCHGSAANGNYWPDTPGSAAYPDNAGAHLNHVNAIGKWIYGEDASTLGAGLYVTTAQGSSDAKQKAICAWCHANPGDPRTGKAGEIGHDDNGAWTSPADLLGDGIVAGQFQLYYNGTLAPLPRGSVTDTDATFAAGTHSCSNVNCHNRIATPTGANNWNVPPVWTTTSCGTIQCHSTPAVSGAHATHYDTASKGYACAQCHVFPASLQHGNGQVNLDWTAGLESDGDGFYDHDANLAASAGDNNFTPEYGGAVPQFRCWNIYCHGDFTGGRAANQPRWGTVADGDCGTCHNATSVTLANGSHPTHFDAVYGPNLGATCATCHTGSALTDATHVNGTKNLVISTADPTATILGPPAGTAVCNNCHGISSYDTETIKQEWGDVAPNTYAPASVNPDVTCESCHGGGDMPAWQNAGGTGARAPANGANFASQGHGLPSSSTYTPSGRSGANAQCVDCHGEASAHFSGALGQDRLDTAGNDLCSSCHDGGGAGSAVTQVSTHANTSGTMGSAPVSYTAQRAQFELNCVECHDVHGTTNIFMVNTANPDGPLVAMRTYNGGADTTNYLFQGSAVAFTAKVVGSDYAQTVANANRICQTCHTTTGGAGTEVYQHDNTTIGHATSPCIACHGHDVDTNYAAISQDGFMPKGCTACHDAASPYDPDAGGSAPAAPGINLALWTSSGHGMATGPAVLCSDCHDIGLPSAPTTHLDGTVNTIWGNGTVASRNTNTAHLRAEYFAPYTGVAPAGNAWDIQVTFDNRCYSQCHAGKAVKDMRHERDTLAGANNHWSVQMGTHLSYPNGDRSGTPGDDALNAPYPTDCDLNTGANCADTDYAPCVSCHDPHGTNVVDPASPETNFMMRRKWINIVPPESHLCQGCHP